MVRRFGLSTRVIVFVLLFLVAIAGLIAQMWHVAKDTTEASVAELERVMMTGEQEKLQIATHALAVTLAESLTKVAPAERDARVRALVDPVRYGTGSAGYFFVYRGTVNVAHVKKELEGTDMGGMKDVHGTYLIRELASQASKGGGFVRYVFPKPGAGDTPKLSYAENVPGTDLWIGTGIYLDDVDAAKASVRATAAADGRKIVLFSIGASLVALLFVFLPLAFLLVRSITRPVAEMASAAQRIAEGDLDVEVTAASSDEIGRLADAFRSMIAYMREVSTMSRALSEGTFEVAIAPRSEKDQLSANMMRVVEKVRTLVARVSEVAEDATRGRLDSRLDVSEYSGGYGRLAGGVNAMVDAFLAPIAEATEVLELMAARDLSRPMRGEYRGDHARLQNALNTALENLRVGLLQVSRGAEQVKSASTQIASGSQGLASGASEQAAALTETRATLGEVDHATSENAASAERARELVQTARERSDVGSEAMHALSTAVDGIHEAVTNTAEIIRDINQIAFQTNLLALNAAVEAARAGDAGRGFAVVADEVRNLAQQSKGAALKTEELLRSAIEQSDRGQAITREVATGLTAIVTAVGDVDTIVRSMADASARQAAGVRQVSQATEQMDHVTQQNAAASEELSSTAEELAAQSLELTAMVQQFELDADRAETLAPVRSTGDAPVPAFGRRDDALAFRDF